MTSIQILDGGLGTSLEDQHGIVFNTNTPLWASHLLVADTPTLLNCQANFIKAGVDILLTATYQVSIEGFARTKIADFPNGIPRDAIGPFLTAAVNIAEQAKARANSSAKIALSLGPYGACMIPGQEYSGKYDSEHNTEDTLFQWHLDRLQLFLDADGSLIDRVQYVAFETLPRLDEIRAVRRAMLAAGIKVPFWVSCVFPGEGELLPDGSTVAQVVEAVSAQMDDGVTPWGIGINCTKINKLPGLLENFGVAVANAVKGGQIQTVPTLVLYPDGTNGEVYNTATQTWEKTDTYNTEDMRPWELALAEVVNDARSRGPFTSFLVGGCCKASHHDIKKLREQFRTS